MKISFHGPINTGQVIRKSITDIFDMNVGLMDSDLQIERMTINPDPLSTIGLADSDFGFTTTIDVTSPFDSS